MNACVYGGLLLATLLCKPWNQYEASAKIAETLMTFTPAQDSMETVTIKLSDRNGTGVISVEWGKLRLTAEFKPAP